MGMECPFCGSLDVDVPEVDVGVGYVQCAPASCMECGAGQAYPDADMDSCTEAERKVGWYAGRVPDLYVVEHYWVHHDVDGARIYGYVQRVRGGRWRALYDRQVMPAKTQARAWRKLARAAREARVREVLKRVDDSEGLRDEFGKAACSTAGRYGP